MSNPNTSMFHANIPSIWHMQYNVRNKISSKTWTRWLQGRMWNQSEWLPKLQETDVQSNKQDQEERSDLAGTNGPPSVAKMREACSGSSLSALALSTLGSLKELHLCGLKLSMLTHRGLKLSVLTPWFRLSCLNCIQHSRNSYEYSPCGRFALAIEQWQNDLLEHVTSDLNGCTLDTVRHGWHQTWVVHGM